MKRASDTNEPHRLADKLVAAYDLARLQIIHVVGTEIQNKYIPMYTFRQTKHSLHENT